MHSPVIKYWNWRYFSMTCIEKEVYSSKRAVTFLTAILLGLSIEAKSSTIVNIGAMFSTTKLTTIFKKNIENINKNLSSSNSSLRLNATTFPMSDNPIRSALDVCENILSKQVHLVIVNQGNCSGDAILGISYTCGFYQVPVIGISSRDAMFSDKVRCSLHFF